MMAIFQQSSQLSGAEFYDAAVALDDVEAVVVRAKKERRSHVSHVRIGPLIR
jgi:hypothetical protein